MQNGGCQKGNLKSKLDVSCEKGHKKYDKKIF